MNNNSIRFKFRKVSTVFIISFCLITVAFLALHFIIVDKYKSVSDNMISEYSLSEKVSNLIGSYNDHYHSNDEDIESLKKINQTKNEINLLVVSIDKTIISRESKANFSGLKNIIKDLVDDIDLGLLSLDNRDIVKAQEYFDSANKKYQFVSSANYLLVFSELKYIESIQSEINQLYFSISVIFGSIILIIILITSFYLSKISKSIVIPIEKLTKIAEDASSEESNITVDENLLKMKDEIGILANSFLIMVTKIKNKILQLNESNKEIEKSKNIAEENNKKLEKLNEFMVGRELKMVELKEKISKLEKK